MADFSDNYGFFDKLLHRLVFATPGIQKILAANESDEHQQALADIQIEKPVFVTSLPRSGTTILLELLSKTGEFVYHRYQDMPFIYTPLLAKKFADKHGKNDALRERAHGDGIQINQQSPEAFEEMFYRAFWPGRYKDSVLESWPEQNNPDFDRFFTDHIKKLLLRDRAGRGRYLSKNNLNVWRINYLKQLFPDARFVVPYREPLQHALSLLKQHNNFTQLHRSNGFAKAYMAGIGHYDFGQNLKPVNFDNWLDTCEHHIDTVEFWLDYWCATYQYLLTHHKEDCLFVGFEQLGQMPDATLTALEQQLALPKTRLSVLSGLVKAAKPHDGSGDSAQTEKARQIYQSLEGLSVTHE